MEKKKIEINMVMIEKNVFVGVEDFKNSFIVKIIDILWTVDVCKEGIIGSRCKEKMLKAKQPNVRT